MQFLKRSLRSFLQTYRELVNERSVQSCSDTVENSTCLWYSNITKKGNSILDNFEFSLLSGRLTFYPIFLQEEATLLYTI